MPLRKTQGNLCTIHAIYKNAHNTQFISGIKYTQTDGKIVYLDIEGDLELSSVPVYVRWQSLW